jgi:hypothetical protein
LWVPVFVHGEQPPTDVGGIAAIRKPCDREVAIVDLVREREDELTLGRSDDAEDVLPRDAGLQHPVDRGGGSGDRLAWAPLRLGDRRVDPRRLGRRDHV